MEIALRPDLQVFLQQTAQERAMSVDELINEVVAHLAFERQQGQLDRELQAYLAMHAQLQTEYFGQWVAVLNQEVVDSDPDHLQLLRRIRTRFPQQAVLLQEITNEPLPEVWLRTPSYGKKAA